MYMGEGTLALLNEGGRLSRITTAHAKFHINKNEQAVLQNPVYHSLAQIAVFSLFLFTKLSMRGQGTPCSVFFNRRSMRQVPRDY